MQGLLRSIIFLLLFPNLVRAFTCDMDMKLIAPYGPLNIRYSDETQYFWRTRKIGDNEKSFSSFQSEYSIKIKNGLPDFDSIPVGIGFSKIATAYGRENLGNSQMIAEATKSIDDATAFALANMNTKAGSHAAYKVQFYRELRDFLDGTVLPFPGQTEDQIIKFLNLWGSSHDSIREAHFRMKNAEDRAIKIDQEIKERLKTQNSFSFELASKRRQALEEAKFYWNIIDRTKKRRSTQ